MEFEEAHDNLHASRLLYKLLEDNTTDLKISNSENVVERARVLLKSLLDVAVEVVFEAHLKTTARQTGNSNVSIEQEKFVNVLQSKSAMASTISRTPEKYQTHSEALQKDEQSPQLELECKKELLQVSNFGIFNTGGTKSKPVNDLDEKNGMMQQNLVKEPNQCNEGILPNIESNHHEEQPNSVNALCGLGEHADKSLEMLDVKVGEYKDDKGMLLLNDTREAECNSGPAKFAECLEQKGDFSDDLVNAIKRIESRILAFKLCSNLADSSKNSAVCDPMQKVANLGSPKLQRKEMIARSQLSFKRPPLEGNRLTNQRTCDLSSKGEKFISENAVEEPLSRNESLSQSQVPYQNCGLHTNAESAKSVYIEKPMLVSGGEDLRSGIRIQPSVQNMAIDRVKSLKRLVSGNAHLGNQTSECIRGLRVPLNQDDLTRKPSVFSCQINRESLIRKTPEAGWSKPDQNHKERSSDTYHAQKLEKSIHTVARKEKLLHHQMVIKPTLLDQRSSEIKANAHQHQDWPVLDTRGTHKTGHVETCTARHQLQHHEPEESSEIKVNSRQQRDWPVLDTRGTHKTGHVETCTTRHQLQHNEPEESSSSSNSNSNSDSSSQWTSQKDSPNITESEDSSLSGGTQGSSVGTQGSKSRRMVDTSCEGSSEDSSDSCLNKDDSPSHRIGSFKSYGHHSKINPKKTSGGLKRLKNKLGLIFHHHHHHHHHYDDNNNGNIISYEGPRNSMWNHLHNVFHHKNKHGKITNQRVEKTRRGAITKVSPRRNQIGQFHRLVEGLLRHIRHSKTQKPSKHGHRQNNLHWWQIVRRRRGVKLKNKGRVKKMGFVGQKSLKYY